MDLATISMPRDEARRAFLDYRSAVRSRRAEDLVAEDEQMMRGYRALARGQQVISLTATIAAGGTFDDTEQKPRLAVARADEPVCWLWERAANGAVAFTTDPRNYGRVAKRSRHSFAAGTLPAHGAITEVEHWRNSHGFKAIIPNVPPHLRPTRGTLALYDILWEVPKWQRVPGAPGDPALIRRIGGDLYAVVAIWDCTELEQAVLLGRRS